MLISETINVEETIKEAEASKADLIVMGPHGRSAIKAAVPGTIAFGVIHNFNYRLQVSTTRKGVNKMKRYTFISFIFLAVSLAACASPRNYPLTLLYQPLSPQYEKTGAAIITVATFSDKRPVSNKRMLGAVDGSEFVALLDCPAAALSKGFAVYLVNRGYTVNRTDEVWDGDIKSMNPDHGDFVLGGTLDGLSINVKDQLLKTEYDCSVKFTLSIADAKTKELLHREKFDDTSSYVTFPFSREKAEELINKALSDAVQKSLAHISEYLHSNIKG